MIRNNIFGVGSKRQENRTKTQRVYYDHYRDGVHEKGYYDIDVPEEYVATYICALRVYADNRNRITDIQIEGDFIACDELYSLVKL